MKTTTPSPPDRAGPAEVRWCQQQVRWGMRCLAEAVAGSPFCAAHGFPPASKEAVPELAAPQAEPLPWSATDRSLFADHVAREEAFQAFARGSRRGRRGGSRHG